jgi:hypothetical protein
MALKKQTFTRRFKILSVLAFTLVFFGTLCAQITKEELSRTIDIGKLQHPYLYFNQADKPAILKRIQTDPECRDIMAGILAEGHRLLYVPVKNPPPPRLQHPRYSATPDEANAYASEISQGSVKLAFLYQMTGDVKYGRKAIEFAVALCDLVEWVEQAHKFDIIYPRVWPWNVPDDRVVFTYDIFASERAIAVSTVYDWVYPELTRIERDKMRNGLLEKAITKVRGNYEFFWWATAYRCNWSAICYSGLGISSMSLLKENPQLLDVVAETYNRMNLTFDQIGDEGGWQEGRGYYGYMMRVSVHFMDILKRLSGGKYNLFTHKKVSAHPFDFPLFSLTANFEDSEGSAVGPTMAVNKLTEETGNTTAAWYREKFLAEGSTLFDILWPRPHVKAVEPEQKSAYFKNINWAILRSDFFDPSAFTIACKAGYNDDPHHGHLDCGQFILTWHDIPFIRDIGRMRYDEIYFNEERWVYPYASSDGHNLIFVNGEKQIPAKLKDQPWKEGIGGNILRFETSAMRDYVLMDPTHAYPGKELRKWRRNIVLDKPVTTLIVDEVESAPGARIEARFFPAVAATQARPGREARFPLPTGVDYKLFRDHVLLSAHRNTLAMIPLVLENGFDIIEAKIPAIPATEDAQLSWIPFLESVTTAKAKTTVLATLFLPVSDQKEAESVVKSATISRVNATQVEVKVERAGSAYRWLFEKGKDGLVLAK